MIRSPLSLLKGSLLNKIKLSSRSSDLQVRRLCQILLTGLRCRTRKLKKGSVTQQFVWLDVISPEEDLKGALVFYVSFLWILFGIKSSCF